MKINELLSDKLVAMFNFDTIIMMSAITLIITISAMVFLKKDKHAWYKQAPSLITTLGIFCTFVGITVGLLRFDPSNENSLNFLLSGLKLAFIPSALAVFIALGFKWIYSKHFSVDHSTTFLSNLDRNNEAIEKLTKAIQLLDWQAAYRENLEHNIEQSAQLLAVLESALKNLVESVNNKKNEVDGAGDGLEQVINNCRGLLTKVNNDLNITTEKLNVKIKGLFENIQQQDKTIGALAEVYGKFDDFNKMINQLGDFASDITSQLKQTIHNEVKDMEVLISRSLKRAVANSLPEAALNK